MKSAIYKTCALLAVVTLLSQGVVEGGKKVDLKDEELSGTVTSEQQEKVGRTAALVR